MHKYRNKIFFRENHYMKSSLSSGFKLCRQWLPQLPLVKGTGTPLTVLSYNLLAPSNCVHTYKYYSNPHDLDWARRLAMIKQEIEHINSDLACLQEVDCNTVSTLIPPGYEHVYAKVSATSKMEGQLTIWKKSRLEIIEKHEVLLNFDTNNTLYCRDQVCLITVFKVVEEKPSESRILLVANCHINFNQERGDRKLAQIHLILQSLHNIKLYFSKEGSRVSCFIMGDFNSTPSSAVYRLLTTGVYDCHLLRLHEQSGQSSCFIPETGLTAKDYQKIIEATSYEIDVHKKLLESEVERLGLWYLTIANTYVLYNSLTRSLSIKYKEELPVISSLYERRTVLAQPEKEKVWQQFSFSPEDFKEAEKSSDNLPYILRSPIIFRNAYSEVCRNVMEYIKNYPDHSTTSPYAHLSTPEEMREKIGEQFNEIPIYYSDFSKTQNIMKNHCLDSGYSHWVNRILKCDYIFYDGDQFMPYQTYEIPNFELIVAETGICPNAKVPSDHLPTAVKFILRYE